MPVITLSDFKKLYSLLNQIPVSAQGGRCVPLIESQKMVREWITQIEHEHNSKQTKKVLKERAKRELDELKEKEIPN